MPTPAPPSHRGDPTPGSRPRRTSTRRPRRAVLLPAGAALVAAVAVVAVVGTVVARDGAGSASVPRSPSTSEAVAGSRVLGEQEAVADAAGVERLSGADRVATAITVARDRFPDGADAVVLATDDDFADALAGTALAKLHDAPLLLNPSGALDDRVADELTGALTPGSTVYVLGGEDALGGDVSDAVISAGFVVSRLAGPDRYATAAAVAGEVLAGSDAPCQLVVATGTDFADGASAAGYVSADRPLVYSRGDDWPSATQQALSRCADGGASAVTAVGGQAAEAVTGAARAEHDGEVPQITAVAGSDRYETSSQLAALIAGQAATATATSGGTTAQQGSRVVDPSRDAQDASDASDDPSQGDDGGRSSFSERAQRAAQQDGDHAAATPTASPTTSSTSSATGNGTSAAPTTAASTAPSTDATASAPAGPRVVLASGDDYTDALVGGTYGGPVLLTPPDSLPSSVAAALTALGSSAGQLLVIGGADAVSPEVAAQAQAAVEGRLPAAAPSAGATSTASPSASGTASSSASPSASASATGKASAAPSASASASSGGGTTTPAAAGASGARAGVPNISGLAWNSGVYIPGSKASNQSAFASWRGTPNDVVVDWAARSNWNDVVNPTWLYDAWKGTKMTKVFGTAMIPEDGSGSIGACATGAYDDKWKQFGSNIAKAGLADTTIIRLGWEFNGDWYAWAAKDPAAWAGCWRKIYTAAESTAPGLRWDWNPNRGKGQSLSDPTKAYPGDAYVDVVGVDSYDGYPAAKDEAGWNEQYNGAFGLKFWRDFAVAHGKGFSVPEWGVYPGTAWAGNNGGDNAFYIQKMNAFFKESASVLAYEAYFNESASYYGGSLFGPAQNPKAAAAYQQLW